MTETEIDCTVGKCCHGTEKLSLRLFSMTILAMFIWMAISASQFAHYACIQAAGQSGLPAGISRPTSC